MANTDSTLNVVQISTAGVMLSANESRRGARANFVKILCIHALWMSPNDLCIIYLNPALFTDCSLHCGSWKL